MAVRGRGSRRPEQQDEIRVIGVRAAEALVFSRPRDVVRAYLTREHLRRFARAVEGWVARRTAYHVVDVEELDRVAGSLHHEGICLLARARPPLDEADLVEQLPPKGPLALLFLDGVDNPNNVGAMVRVAAHFGVPAVMYAALDPRTFRSTAIHRTAEGAAEHVELVEPRAALETLEALRHSGFTVVATSDRAKTSIYAAPLPARAVFLMGSERDGLSQALFDAAEHVVAIPGSGWVESLNVACAASAVLGEWWRVHGDPNGAEGPAHPGARAEPRRSSQGRPRKPSPRRGRPR